jgi:hypothetical protein
LPFYLKPNVMVQFLQKSKHSVEQNLTKNCEQFLACFYSLSWVLAPTVLVWGFGLVTEN